MLWIKFEYLLKVVSSSFPKYLGIIFLLCGFFCTASFPIEWDKNKKKIRESLFQSIISSDYEQFGVRYSAN